MPLPHVESNELLLEMDCAKMLIRWREFVHGRIAASFSHEGKRCSIVLEPCGTLPLIEIPLTECQRDIMDVLKAATRRLTRPEIIENLEAAGKIHGERTVVDALAKLLERQMIVGPRVGSRDGYGSVK